jgi:hypothetical protein
VAARIDGRVLGRPVRARHDVDLAPRVGETEKSQKKPDLPAMAGDGTVVEQQHGRVLCVRRPG